MAAIRSIVEKLQTPMTPAQKADWHHLLTRRLDALDAAAEKPVDKWGRSEQQQKEDAENPCLCLRPRLSTDPHKPQVCAACGFFCERHDCADKCGSCGNFGKCSVWCADNEAYWEPRTWQTCRDCGVYVLGLSDHQKTCDDYIWNETHCDECGELHAHAAMSGEKRCWCAYDQDDLNKMDLVNRR